MITKKIDDDTGIQKKRRLYDSVLNALDLASRDLTERANDILKPLSKKQKDSIVRLFKEKEQNRQSRLVRNGLKLIDIQTLKLKADVSDDVLSKYYDLLSEKYPNKCFMSPHLYNYLMAEGDEFIKNQYFPNNKFLTCQQTFIPIHVNIDETKGHWVLVVINIHENDNNKYDVSIAYFDSMSTQRTIGGRNALFTLEQFVKHIIPKNKLGEIVTEQETNIPQQNNGYDCGVFVLLATRFLAESLPLELYSQKDINEQRFKIAYELDTGRLLS